MNWLPKNSIVVPVDFSTDSRLAVDVALTMARSPARIHVIHVASPATAAEIEGIWDSVSGPPRREATEKTLRGYLSDPKYSEVDLAVAVGDPAQQIAEFADSTVAELIVLPSHGRTGLARLWLGSVAERVVRFAHCPVLVLKKPLAAGESSGS